MKKLQIILAIFFPLLLTAQQTEGTVTYEETIKLNLEMPEEYAEFASRMPKEHKSLKALAFNSKASLYKNVEKEDEDPANAAMEGGVRTVVHMGQSSESEYFKDLETETSVEMKDFMGKRFLIKGEQKKIAWKLTGEQKAIHGYTCQKATFTDSSKTVEAWFTSQIPVSTGPEGFGGLPGLILEVSMDDGDAVITAQDISLESLPANTLKAPKKGKEVTREKFEEIVAEKTKEMGAQMGGSGRGPVRVMIRRN